MKMLLDLAEITEPLCVLLLEKKRGCGRESFSNTHKDLKRHQICFIDSSYIRFLWNLLNYFYI